MKKHIKRNFPNNKVLTGGVSFSYLDIILAFDEFQNDRGFSQRLLIKELLDRQHFFTKNLHHTIQSIVIELLDSAVCFADDVLTEKDIETLIVSMNDGDGKVFMIGWPEHSVGMHIQKHSQGCTISIINSGHKHDYHGVILEKKYDDTYQVPAILIFDNIDEKTTVKTLIDCYKITKGELPNGYLYFYRIVLNYISHKAIDPTDVNFEALYKRCSRFIILPAQTTGDCVFRSIFFAIACDNRIVDDDEIVNNNLPSWLWTWYAILVYTSVFRFNASYKELKFGASELIALRTRVKGLKTYITQFGDKAIVQKLHELEQSINASLASWYSNNVLVNDELMLTPTNVQIVTHPDLKNKKITEYEKEHDNKNFLYINESNKINIYVQQPSSENIIDDINDLKNINNWTEFCEWINNKLFRQQTTFMNKSKRMPYGLLFALIIKLYKLFLQHEKLNKQHIVPLLKFMIMVTQVNVYASASHHHTLLLGLCYVLVRQLISEGFVKDKTYYDALFKTFGTPSNGYLNEVLLSREHYNVLNWVTQNIINLGAMVNAETSINAVFDLHVKNNKAVWESITAQFPHYNYEIRNDRRILYEYIHKVKLDILKEDINIKTEEAIVFLVVYLSSVFEYGTIPKIVEINKNNRLIAINKATLLNNTPAAFDYNFNFISQRNSLDVILRKLDISNEFSFTSSADFYLQHGVLSEKTETCMFRINTEKHALKQAIIEFFPSLASQTNKLLIKYKLLLELSNVTKKQWNLIAHCLLYITGLLHTHGNNSNNLNDIVMSVKIILNDKRCNEINQIVCCLVLKSLTGSDHLSSRSLLDDTILMQKILNRPPLDSDALLDSDFYPENRTLHSLHEDIKRKISMYEEPLHDICILSRICFDIIYHEVNLQGFVRHKETVKELLTQDKLSTYNDVGGNYCVIYNNNAKQCTTCKAFQYWGRQLNFTLRNINVSVLTCVPTTSRQYCLSIKNNNFYIHEPLPPHFYFQNEFTWSQSQSSTEYYGVPKSTNILKFNNYSLSYNPDTRQVKRQQYHKNNNSCKLESKSTITFVPIESVFADNIASPSLKSLCSHLLTFCFAEGILIWKNETENEYSYFVEVLRHGAIFVLSEDGIITLDSMKILQSTKNFEQADALKFWTYNIPCSFIAQNSEGELFLVVFDVHRKSKVILDSMSSILHGYFSTCEYEINVNTDSNVFLLDMSYHKIPLHYTKNILLPSYAKAIFSYYASAWMFGRMDVCYELSHQIKYYKQYEPLTELTCSNFPRVLTYNKSNENSSRVDVNCFVTINGSLSIIGSAYLIQDQKHIMIAWTEVSKAKTQLNYLKNYIDKDNQQQFESLVQNTKNNDIVLFRSIQDKYDVPLIDCMLQEVISFTKSSCTWRKIPLLYACFMFLQNLIPRAEQIALVNAIMDNYNNEQPQIHNLIMGAGKTSVITPLVVLNALFGIQNITFDNNNGIEIHRKDNVNNVVLVTLPKLVKQTIQLLTQLSIHLDFKIVAKPNSIDPHFWNEHRQRVVYVLTDHQFKESIINRTDKPPESLYYVFDEIDMMMNPLTAELNVPDTELSLCTYVTMPDSRTSVQNLSEQEILFMKYLIDIVIAKAEQPISFGHLKHDKNERLLERITSAFINEVIPFCKTQEENLNYGLVQVDENITNLLEQLIHNKDNIINNTEKYAMAQDAIKQYHMHIITALPYIFADTPSVGSEFNDPLITIYFTVVETYRNGLNVVQMHQLLEHCKSFLFSKSQSTVLNYEYLIKNYSLYYESINEFQWLKENEPHYRNDTEVIYLYLSIFLSKVITITPSILSANGLDMIMAKNHKYRSGFTGTPEKGVEIYDVNPISILDKIISPDEEVALSKLRFHSINDNLDVSDVIIENITQKQCNVIIDVGAQFKGITPYDLLCKIYTKSISDNTFQELQLVYWSVEDIPMVLNIRGETSVWNGRQTNDQIIFYDNAHTTGTDAKLLDKVYAYITIRHDTRYRDFIQGLFRLRKISKVEETQCTVIASKDVVVFTNHDLFKEFLNTNEDLYVKQQDSLRFEHNILALLRSCKAVSDKSRCLQETNIDYIRTKTYNASLIDNTIKQGKNNNDNIVKYCLLRMLTCYSTHMQEKPSRLMTNIKQKTEQREITNEQEKEQEKEQEEEQEEEQEKKQVIKYAYTNMDMPYDNLIHPAEEMFINVFYKISSGVYVSKFIAKSYIDRVLLITISFTSLSQQLVRQFYFHPVHAIECYQFFKNVCEINSSYEFSEYKYIANDLDTISLSSEKVTNENTSETVWKHYKNNSYQALS